MAQFYSYLILKNSCVSILTCSLENRDERSHVVAHPHVVIRPRHGRFGWCQLTMHLRIVLTIIFFFFVHEIRSLDLLKAMIVWDTPICSAVCTGKTAKKLGVKALDARENCQRPDFQNEWRKCIYKACWNRNHRRKVEFSLVRPAR